MNANNDPALSNLKLVILDNNSNRAGGGFWTTYYPFAPLLLTSAEPTPSDTTAPIVDVGYEYNVNSNAVPYPTNVVSDLNSLVAYAYGYGYGAQESAPMPDLALEPVEPGAQHYHYVVAPDGTVVQTIPVNGNITYVTFQSDGLPLTRPLKMLPGGSILADGNKAIPGATHDGATSPGRANPVTQVVGNISSALGDLAKGLTKSASKTTPSTTSEPSS